MRKSVTAKQIQKLDKIAIERFGIPSIVLMENAGRASAEILLTKLQKIKNPKVTVVCGLGNNAGDGFVIARHLSEAGVDAGVFSLIGPDAMKPDPRINFQILKKLKVPVRVVQSLTPLLHKSIQEADVIVDALFGVGLSREIRSPYCEVIECINGSKAKVLAVDVPSGLDATTGVIHGVCVKADWTVTFSLPKKGFTLLKGPGYTGWIKVVDIGIPKTVMSC